MAVTAMGGCWVLEQHRSSLVDWHPRIRLLWRLLPEAGRLCLTRAGLRGFGVGL